MRRRDESGFALLLVFLMAAIIALSLYMEIPRVAFESQRHKEQLLVERGEQYKRAIQVFVKHSGTGRWPAKIADLENYNNRRFLRHRFLDPMTGKDDWRIIHINNGVFTDSVTMKPKQSDQKQAASTAGQYVGEVAGLGQTLAGSSQGASAKDRRRPSEGGTTTGTGTDLLSGMGNVPTDAGAQSGASGSSGAADASGQPATTDSSGTQGSGNTSTPSTGNDTSANPSSPAATTPTDAAKMIQGLLTTPRPQGAATSASTGNTLGGGMAGVASKADMEGIMVYGERTNYSEWEFLFDLTKEKAIPNPNSTAVPMPGTPGGPTTTTGTTTSTSGSNLFSTSGK